MTAREQVAQAMRLVARHWAALPTGTFFAVHAAYLLFSSLAMRMFPSLLQGNRDPFLMNTPALDGLCRWDCGYYLLIATSGYDAKDFHTANVWPGYALVGRALTAVTTLDIHYTLLIVSNAAALASLICVYRVFQRVTQDDEAAKWGLFTFVAWPFHFFQAAGYPESAMVCASALAMLLALKGHHLWAGLALGVGASMRHLTLLMGLGLAGVQYEQRGRTKALLWSPAVLGLVIPFLFPLAFSMYQWHLFGDPLAFWNSRNLWGEKAWLSVRQVVTDHSGDPRLGSYVACYAVLAVTGVVLLVKKQWRSLGLAVAPLLLMLGSVGAEGLGRYSASAWPAFLPLGVWLARRPPLRALVVGLALLQGLFFYLFVHQYPIN